MNEETLALYNENNKNVDQILMLIRIVYQLGNHQKTQRKFAFIFIKLIFDAQIMSFPNLRKGITFN
jgi:hypothetical protein